MIRLDAVTMTYPAGTRSALRDLTLRIDQGEFVYLVGPSGSGKSTLLRLLLREERATSGCVTLDGVDLAAIPDRKVPLLRRAVGCVFQDFRLLPDRTVAGNVAFALDVVGRPRHVVRAIVPEVLALVGLEGKESRYPDELSGGEQQRVAIARAFVGRPRVLLADEPTGNLDPATSEGIMRLLDAVNRTGTTVVMATHNASLVDARRRRVIELADGRCVRDEHGGAYDADTEQASPDPAAVRPDTVASDTVAPGTVGPGAAGSDSIGSDMVGSGTVGSVTVGSDTGGPGAAAAAGHAGGGVG